jgi:hypothetical protein
VSGRERVECICCRAQLNPQLGIANEQTRLVRQTAHAMFSWPSGRLPVWPFGRLAMYAMAPRHFIDRRKQPLAKQQRHGSRDPTIPQIVSHGPATRVYGKRPVNCGVGAP